MFLLILVFLILLSRLEFVQGASDPTVNPATFCYDEASCGQTTWGGLCNTGRSQSPIDIQLKPFLPYFAPPINFVVNNNYAKGALPRFYGQNNGHSAQFDATSNLSALTSNLEIGGGDLGTTYKFAQLHFHWAQTNQEGSEHRINGIAYPMELHIVHFKSNFASFADALASNEPDAIAVMAIFFKVTPFKNNALEPIVQALTQLEAPGVVKEFDLNLRILELYPKKLEFARYFGSLTTPNCNEQVIWTVFLRPVLISVEQMTAFRRLTNEEQLSSFNFRNTQLLNGRTVSYFKGIFTRQPLIATFNSFVNLFQLLFYILKNTLNYFSSSLRI